VIRGGKQLSSAVLARRNPLPTGWRILTKRAKRARLERFHAFHASRLASEDGKQAVFDSVIHSDVVILAMPLYVDSLVSKVIDLWI